MFKKTIIAFSAMAAFGIASPVFADGDDADDSNVNTPEENRLDQSNREDNLDRSNNNATVERNANDVRQDRIDAAQADQDTLRNDADRAKAGVIVKRDSQGRNCIYTENGVEKTRESCM